MSQHMITAVGIDVSKAKNMIAVRRLGGEIVLKPFQINHTVEGIQALVAFAGVDAPPFQSGSFEAKSRHISKRGSPHLRKALFQVMSAVLQHASSDNPVYCFMDKKRAEGKHFYVYTVAGAANSLRIYYARVCEYLTSLSESNPVAA